jgi:hypothetical protein
MCTHMPVKENFYGNCSILWLYWVLLLLGVKWGKLDSRINPQNFTILLLNACLFF